MTKINKEIAVFIVVIVLVFLWGFFTKAPIDTKSTDYNSNIMPNRYYIIVDKDKRKDVKNELRKEENWTDPVFPDIKKGNYYIITVTEQATQDKNFLEIMEKNNLQVKKSVYCYIYFVDGSQNEISDKDAIRIKNELEKNDKVLIVSPAYST